MGNFADRIARDFDLDCDLAEDLLGQHSIRCNRANHGGCVTLAMVQAYEAAQSDLNSIDLDHDAGGVERELDREQRGGL